MLPFFLVEPIYPMKFSLSMTWAMCVKKIYRYGINKISSRRTLEGLEKTKAGEMLVRIECPYNEDDYPSKEFYGTSINERIRNEFTKQILEGIENAEFDYSYGDRIKTKYKEVIEILTEKPFTRQCVLTIFLPEDLESALLDKEVPCCCLLRFYRVLEKLNMQVVFRSIDIVGGAPNDFYAFRALQNKVVNDINEKLGAYGFSLDFGYTSFYLMDAHIREEEFELVDNWIRRGLI